MAGLIGYFLTETMVTRNSMIQVDTVLMGRKTYETARRLGERFAGKVCYVLSRNAPKYAPESNIHFESDPVGLVKRLITESG